MGCGDSASWANQGVGAASLAIAGSLPLLQENAELMARRAIEKFRPQLRSTTQRHPQNPPPEGTPAIATSASADSVPFADAVVEPQAATVAPEPVASEPDPLLAPLPRPPRKTTLQQLQRGAKLIGVPLVWMGVMAFCGGTAYSAYTWLTDTSPIPNCDRLWFFSRDADKLYCAEQAIQQQGSEQALLSGLELATRIPDYHYLHQRATQLQKNWSNQVVQVAQDRAMDGDLAGAIALAKQLPPGNPSYRDAKNLVLEWSKLRDREANLLAKIEIALQKRDWNAAEAVVQPESTSISEYERHQLNRLTERIVSERVAYNQLRQLRQLVEQKKPGDPLPLGRAIQLALQINPKAYVGQAVQADIERWSGYLVQIADAQLAQRNLNGAITTAQWLPETAALTPSVRHLLWVYRAQQLDWGEPTKPPTAEQLWQISTALSSLGEIPANSPLYTQAQALAQGLEKHLQDLTQLSLANTAAQAQQPASLQVAIAMASAITSDRPHRLQAQTLMADWRNDIQRLADRPYLTAARQLAKSGQIKDLQAAIAQATQVKLGRPLRAEAQAAIFDWKQKIQVIEDQPILTQARKLAQQKQLGQAIAQAAKVPPGRALYPEAQATIAEWTRQIQLTEDQPILAAARALASQNDWGAAIDVAYQIAPGRALYNEAQKSIADWSTRIETERSRDRSDRYARNWDETNPTRSDRDRRFYR